MEIFEFLKDFSWEVLAISFIVFALTMIIKLPIKKATAKLAENKRKAINSVIILIPIILSFVTTTLFFGIVNDVWFSFNIVYPYLCQIFKIVIFTLIFIVQTHLFIKFYSSLQFFIIIFII